MALDPKYICTSDLESVFLDKLTGLVLAGGRVQFYINGTNTPKEVFTTTGSPPTGFISLGTTVTLDSIGQYSNGVNSVVVYYYPYTSSGALELYECRVYSSDNILQFTRQAWPPLANNLAPAPNSDAGIKNYIPNGQFLSHNTASHFVTDTTTESGITISEIAQGGWSFKHTTAGTGTYVITFNSESGFPSGLQDAPNYSVNVACTSFNSSDVIRDLVIQWPDVNIFSRKLTGAETNPFNLFFAAKLNSGSSQVFNIYMIRNYGSGGSTSDEDLLTSVTITNSYQYFNVPVLMPDNNGKTFGSGSFIALAIRTPSNSTCDVRFTDFAFTLSSTTLTQFPIMTDDEQLSRGVAGWMPAPNPDGSDLYLPLRLTPQGLQFDHTIVGSIIGKLQSTAGTGELAMDGSHYIYANYSTDGIPYSRLGAYLISNSPQYTEGGGGVIPAGNIPIFGTGTNFVSIWDAVGAGDFVINMNTADASNTVTVATTSPTGFTISASADPIYTLNIPAKPAASTFFSFSPNTGGGLSYNVWFTVDGVGTAPATPTGANILVPIVTADTVATTITKIQTAVHKYQYSIVNAAGYFWRGYGGVDPDTATRATQILYDGSAVSGSGVTGADLGSSQTSAFKQHTHTVIPIGNADAGGGTHHLQQDATNDGQTSTTFNTGNASVGGGNETRSINLALNWFIKY